MTARTAMKLLASLVLLWASTVSLQAREPLQAPQDTVILKVTGKLAVTNDGEAASFDRAMLASLPQTTLTSYTDWTSGEQTFTGVLLKDLLERIGAEGDSVNAIALNDYTAEIPWDDLGRFRVLLALTRNGAEMSVRDKGPIWIIYPNDQPPGSTPFQHNDKMVWQLARLNVE